MSQGRPHLGPVCWGGSPLLATVLPGFRKEPFPAAGLAYLSLFVTAPRPPTSVWSQLLPPKAAEKRRWVWERAVRHGGSTRLHLSWPQSSSGQDKGY